MAVKKTISGITPRRKFSFKKAYDLPNEGKYVAKIINAEITSEVMTGLGTTSRMAIELELQDGRLIHQNFLLIEHPKQPAYQLVMLIFNSTDYIRFDEMVGKEIGIEITHNTNSNGYTFANVTRVFDIAELEETVSTYAEDELNI